MNNCKILDKTVLKFNNEPEKFLNALTTNELDKPLTAFLDRFGKLIALANQIKINNEIYMIIESKFKEQLLNHLEKYLKLSKTKVEDSKLKVIHYMDTKERGIQLSIGKLVLLEKIEKVNEISDEEYLKVRLENNIPIQGIDFSSEMFLEVNLLEAISFTKGCYLGQEIIARVHARSKPVRKLVRISSKNKLSKITLNNEELGKVTSACYSEKYKTYLHFAIIKDYDKKLDNAILL